LGFSKVMSSHLYLFLIGGNFANVPNGTWKVFSSICVEYASSFWSTRKNLRLYLIPMLFYFSAKKYL